MRVVFAQLGLFAVGARACVQGMGHAACHGACDSPNTGCLFRHGHCQCVRSDGKVSVNIACEAGAESCQKGITGPLDGMVQAVGELIALDYRPWGKSYYETIECGGPSAHGTYNGSAWSCWFEACTQGGGLPQPYGGYDDCFLGPVVAEHGEMEVQANKWQACARRLAPSWQAFWPFVVCMEARYKKDGHAIEDAARICTTAPKVKVSSFDRLKACFNGVEGTLALKEAAQDTWNVDGLPFVELNGRRIGLHADLVKQVCKMYAGNKPKPLACGNASLSEPAWVV